VICELYGRLCDGRRFDNGEQPEEIVIHAKNNSQVLWVPGGDGGGAPVEEQELYRRFCVLPDRIVYVSVDCEVTEPLWRVSLRVDPCVAFTSWRDWLVGFKLCQDYKRSTELESHPGDGFYKTIGRIRRRQEAKRKRRDKKTSGKV